MNFIPIIFKGFGQVLFQENILFGFLLAIGLGLASPITLLLSFLGNITGSLMAILFNVKKGFIEAGLYGFNGVLIGAMVSFYIKQFPIAILVTFVASLVAAILFYLLFRNNIPPFAAPFVLVAWAIIILLKLLKL